jgi:hypothetical protein
MNIYAKIVITVSLYYKRQFLQKKIPCVQNADHYDIKKNFSVFSCVSPGKILSTSSPTSNFSGGG